ncbi:MAG: hypothetical protein IKM94_04310 [Alphaproteobacteria bacterium]|nr:hypothetical protein [Alphaproteobacteria bacterium]
MGWTRLPSEYQEVEYLESTGTQYIDTGVIINSSNYKKEATIGYWYANNGKSSNGVAFGSLMTGKRSPFVQNNYYSSDGPDIWRIGVGQQEGVRSSYHVTPAPQNGKSTVILKQDNDTFYYGNSESSLQSVSVDYSNTLTNSKEFVFCVNYNNAPNFYAPIKLYSYKLWINNELVRNLVPAKNSSNVIGMYDMVSGTFFTNQGTGTFVEGPEI